MQYHGCVFTTLQCEDCVYFWLGADKYGRPVISMAACRLPPSYQISHDRLLE